MTDPIRAALAAPTPEPDTDAVLRLAAIIREVDGSHSLGAAALAEAILSHPAAREVFAATTPPAGEATMSDTARAVLQRLVDAFRIPGQSLPIEEWIAMAEDVLAAPTPSADGEAEELAQWLYRLADERTCNRRRGIRPHPSALTRAAVLLQRYSAGRQEETAND